MSGEFQLKQGETLQGKDKKEFLETVWKIRDDPVYFFKHIINIDLYPKQEEFVREFYRHKYDHDLDEYKKLVLILGQRCLSGESLIKTQNGVVQLDTLYPSNMERIQNKPIPLQGITIFNGSEFTPATEIIYTGQKQMCVLIASNGYRLECSEDHKISSGGKWVPFKYLHVGDPIDVHPFSGVRVMNVIRTNYYIDMYDLHVPEGNCYIADGILVHNSGKTLIGAGILLYEFHELLSYDNPHARYGVGTNNKGEPMKLIGCTCVSTSKDQASDGVFANVKLLLKGSDYFKKYYLDSLHITDLRIDCDDKMIFLMVKAPKIDTAAGYENKIVLYDEMDLMQYGSTTQKNDTRGSKVAAHNVYSKLNNSTQTFGARGKIVAMSSLQRQDGIMMLAYNEAKTENDALAISAKTWEVNPNPELQEDVLRERYKNRMDEFYRDFANMPEVGGSSLFPERVRLNKAITNVLMTQDPLPEEYLHPHVLAIDPASHNDSFGVACAFRHGDRLVVDGARKFNKPLSKDSYIKPSDIQDFINLQMERLNVFAFLTDVYHYPNILEDVRDKWGIEPIQKFADGESYSLWRELQSDIGGVQLHVVYDEALENECNNLTYVERGISGKLNVDHPYKGSKDTADAVCNCIWYLATNPEVEPYIPYSTVMII